MVCGATIDVFNKDLQRGFGVVTKLVIPRPKAGDAEVAGFYKKSRRKTFDLSVINMALLAKLRSNVVEEIRVALGGAEEVYVLPKAGGVMFHIFFFYCSLSFISGLYL